MIREFRNETKRNQLNGKIMNELYALFFVPTISHTGQFVSASNEIDKLSQSVPGVNTWTDKRDPNDKSLQLEAESPMGKYLIRQVLYIC